MVIGTYIFKAINFLVVILLIVINDYSINGHYELFYWWLFSGNKRISNAIVGELENPSTNVF